MTNRVNDKISEIERYLGELSEWTPKSFEEYKDDPKTKSACERNFEKVIELIIDVAFILIKENKFKIPDDEESSFNILAKEKIISDELAEKLRQAKGMRNIIAHEYGKIDDELVFESIEKQIIKDAEEFIKCVELLLK